MTELFELPAILADIPGCAVDIFLCNLLPVDEDSCWGDAVRDVVEKKILELQKCSENYFCGKVTNPSCFC